MALMHYFAARADLPLVIICRSRRGFRDFLIEAPPIRHETRYASAVAAPALDLRAPP